MILDIESAIRRFEVLVDLFGNDKRDNPVECNKISMDTDDGKVETLMDFLLFDIEKHRKRFGKRDFQASVRKFLYANRDIAIDLDYNGISKFNPSKIRHNEAIPLSEWLKL